MKDIEKIVEEFKNHPALKFADDAIVLQALRSGTSGYTGDENLVEFLEKALTTIYNKGKEEERERIIDMVKTTKEAYMFPSTEERFINDINQ